MTRTCGACGATIAPYEVQNLVGIPLVHRYRCAGCTTKFDIMTTFGRSLLAAMNVVILAIVLLLPDSKFKTPDDRTWILVALLGVQIPIVAVLLFRSIKNDRRHRRVTPAT